MRPVSRPPRLPAVPEAYRQLRLVSPFSCPWNTPRVARSRYCYARANNLAVGLKPHRHAFRVPSSATIATGTPSPSDRVYFPGFDVEDLEYYRVGGYHPTLIGDRLRGGRYEIVHKLGFGGYSTTWLARDKQQDRYVALKILVASEATKSPEARILRLLSSPSAPAHEGRRFIPKLLDDFSLEGPNGRHIWLVQEAAICSIAASKEDAADFMFPAETARSIAAQLNLGLLYLHSRGVCHGDLHSRNFLIYGPAIERLTPEELYEGYDLSKTDVKRIDGGAVEPHAPPYAVHPLAISTPADEVVDPIRRISDYGTSFVVAEEPSPTLHTPPLYLPPEAFFDEPATLAADVWTLGVSLHEILGERPLFETVSWDRDDILAEMVSTLGRLPQRWWNRWANRGEFFEDDDEWKREGYARIATPAFRRLHRRMWDMGRGETPEACQWDVEGCEMRALEEMLRGMLAYEPGERLTAEELVASEYMVKWALPAWERQLSRMGEERVE